MTPLYETDDGTPVATHSMLKTFRRCPKQAEYKYVRRLKPKVLGRPLRAGTWGHRLIEVHHKGGDWHEEHARLSAKFGELFDEERDEIGDLPVDMDRIMRSYFWHYASDEWKVLETEFILETTFPDGTVYRAKIDLLIENQFGLWIVDHKFHKKQPDYGFRILDSQSALYVWAAVRNKIPVQGHIWNYVRSKPPAVPEMLKSGKGPARWAKIDTDYPTAGRWFREHPEIERGPYAPKLKRLRSQRYVPGEPQTSPFFRRVILEKNDEMLKQVAREAYNTATRIGEYRFDSPAVERVVDRSCTFMCSYTDLCTAELFTGATPVDLKRRYGQGDPLDYYNDDRWEEKDIG